MTFLLLYSILLVQNKYAEVIQIIMLSTEERNQVIKQIKEDCSCKNLPVVLMDYIESAYDKNNLINTYGDVYYITKKISHTYGTDKYLCRRVLWSLTLSSELYEVTQYLEQDSDGDFAYYEYDIRMVKDNG